MSIGRKKRASSAFFAAVLCTFLIPKALAFDETWDSASVGVYTPDQLPLPFISSDEGQWYLGDTVSEFPECGTTPHKAEIFAQGSGDLALRLTSNDSNSSCADNVWIDLSEIPQLNINMGFSVQLNSASLLSFKESGYLTDPQSGSPYCISPPCGDTISLIFIDNNDNVLAYVLQRSPDAEPNLVYPNYREIFLDDSGAYMRNVFDDFSTIPDFNPVNPEIVSIVFSVNEHGEAVIDDIQIGQTIYPDTDSDGVADVVDNCVSMPNSGQQDSDSDGYGNACDADLDNTGGVVNFSDLALFKSAFGTSNPDADFDGSGGVVNFADLAIFKQLFGKAPGPSCCGTLSP